MTIPVTREKLINEISLLPEDKIGEVYNFIHYFRLGAEKKIPQSENILSFSGCWENMDDELFNGYLSDIANRRSKAFNSRGR